MLENVFPQPSAEWSLSLRPCMIRNGRLVPNGDSAVMKLREAAGKFASSGTHGARNNVISARAGNYLGILSTKTGFLLVNRVSGGDISWLLKKRPELEKEISEIYLVEDVVIPRSAIDLPPIGTHSDLGA